MLEGELACIASRWKILHSIDKEEVQRVSVTPAWDLAVSQWCHSVDVRVVLGTTNFEEAELFALGTSSESIAIVSLDRFEQDAEYAYQIGRSRTAEKLKKAVTHRKPEIEHSFLRRMSLDDSSYQLACLLDGMLTIRCPFTNKVATSINSFAVAHDDAKHVALFYRMETCRVYYICMSAFTSSKSFIYIPSIETIISLRDPNEIWGHPVGLVKQFMSLVMSSLNETIEYIADPARKLCVLTGATKNVGHEMWNDAAALLKMERLGALNNVDIYLKYKLGTLNTIDLIDIHDKEILLAKDAHELFRTCLNKRLFVVKPGTVHMDEETAQAIKQNSFLKQSDENKRAIKDALRSDVILWINLRAHNKVWINQVSGIVAAVRHAEATRGSVFCFLDGTSDCADIVKELRAALPKTTSTFDGTALPLDESIAWAFAVDIYIAVIGSGLTLVTWLAAKPGVAVSETAHLDQMGFWPEVRPGIPTPFYPRHNQVQDFGEASYCNYEISAEVIVDLFASALKGVPLKRHALAIANHQATP